MRISSDRRVDGVGERPAMRWARLPCGKKSRWFLAGVALVAVLWFCRRPILTGLARPLIVDDRPEDFDYVWVQRGADRVYDAAARLYQDKPSRRMIVVQPEPSRLVRLGIISSDEEVLRQELAARGVGLPEGAVLVVGRGSRNAWQGARQLAEWLRQHPEARVLALVSRFHSARQRAILNAVLGAGQAERVGIVALPHRTYDEGNWWTSRTGVKEFIFAWLGRVHTSWAGEPEAPPALLEPDAFDRLVAERSAEVSP
jgi:hypothetical protein